MRKTQLKRTGIGVVVFTAGVVLLMSVIRAAVFSAEAAGVEDGAALFENKGCAQCHYTDSTETKIGPGLEGLFARDRLPVSGRPVTSENIRRQLQNPYDAMPSFADRLTEDQTAHLVVYLKSL